MEQAWDNQCLRFIFICFDVFIKKQTNKQKPQQLNDTKTCLEIVLSWCVYLICFFLLNRDSTNIYILEQSSLFSSVFTAAANKGDYDRDKKKKSEKATYFYKNATC